MGPRQTRREFDMTRNDSATATATMALGRVLATKQGQAIMAALIEREEWARESCHGLERFEGRRPTRAEVDANRSAGFDDGYATALRNTLTMMVKLEGADGRAARRAVSDELWYATENGVHDIYEFLRVYYG